MEILNQNPQFASYIALFFVTVALRVTKLFTTNGVPWNSYFSNSFELAMAFSGVLIILVNQHTEYIFPIVLVYLFVIVTTFNVDSWKFSPLTKTVFHIVMSILIIASMFFSFIYWIKPNSSKVEKGVYRVSIPYIDNTLIQHLGDRRGNTLSPSVFTLDINASNMEDARTKALKIFNDPMQEPRPFKATAPKNAINLIKLDDKITAEFLGKK